MFIFRTYDFVAELDLVSYRGCQRFSWKHRAVPIGRDFDVRSCFDWHLIKKQVQYYFFSISGTVSQHFSGHSQKSQNPHLCKRKIQWKLQHGYPLHSLSKVKNYEFLWIPVCKDAFLLDLWVLVPLEHLNLQLHTSPPPPGLLYFIERGRLTLTSPIDSLESYQSGPCLYLWPHHICWSTWLYTLD